MAIMIEYFSTIYGIVEIMAMIASILLLTKDRSNKWKSFIGYLLIMIGVEILGTYSKLHKMALLNHSAYNFLLLVQIIFFISFLFSILRVKNKNQFRLALLFLLSASFFIELSLHHFQDYAHYTKFLLSFVITILSCIFFYRLMLMQHQIDLIYYPDFWVAVGFFFYGFVGSVIFAYNNIFSQHKIEGDDNIYLTIMNIVSGFLYFSWIISFICRKKQVKSLY